MMATVHHVTSSSGLRKFQADGFLFDGLYNQYLGHASYRNTRCSNDIPNAIAI
jgi:hypothetical protein